MIALIDNVPSQVCIVISALAAIVLIFVCCERAPEMDDDGNIIDRE